VAVERGCVSFLLIGCVIVIAVAVEELEEIIRKRNPDSIAALLYAARPSAQVGNVL